MHSCTLRVLLNYGVYKLSIIIHHYNVWNWMTHSNTMELNNFLPIKSKTNGENSTSDVTIGCLLEKFQFLVKYNTVTISECMLNAWCTPSNIRYMYVNRMCAIWRKVQCIHCTNVSIGLQSMHCICIAVSHFIAVYKPRADQIQTPACQTSHRSFLIQFEITHFRLILYVFAGTMWWRLQIRI